MASEYAPISTEHTAAELDEANALIARKILGYKVRRSSNGRFRIWWTGQNDQLLDVQTVPRFLQDPSADYQILHHVRTHWTPTEMSEFHTEFAIVVSRRLDTSLQSVSSPFFHYQPGDFSRAALAVAVDPPLIQEY